MANRVRIELQFECPLAHGPVEEAKRATELAQVAWELRSQLRLEQWECLVALAEEVTAIRYAMDVPQTR
jgi:hypothetical protein